jgi:ribonuclease P protein component
MLRYLATDDVSPPRVGFAVGRWVGSAVDRNRVRRRLRAAVAARPEDFAPGGIYLFSAGRTAMTLPFDRLVRSVSELARSVGAHP